MTSLLISMLLWVLSQGSPSRIAERNRLKMEAERAFVRRDYALAAIQYRQLADMTLIPEPAVLFNLAHTYFALGDTAKARRQYARLVRTSNPAMAATSLSQLGVLTCRSGDTSRALAYFRHALEVQPEYEPARYNYELISKLGIHRSKSGATPPPPPKPNAGSSAQPQAPSSRQAVATQQRTDFLKKLRQYDLTEEKARMLLDAMRSSEIQYIQQRSRTSATAPTDPAKPAW